MNDEEVEARENVSPHRVATLKYTIAAWVTESGHGEHVGNQARQQMKSSANFPCCVCRGQNTNSGGQPQMNGQGLNMICKKCCVVEPDELHTLCLINWQRLSKMKRALPGFVTADCSGCGQRSTAGDAEVTDSFEACVAKRKDIRVAMSLTASMYSLSHVDRINMFMKAERWVEDYFFIQEGRAYVKAMQCSDRISAMVLDFQLNLLPKLNTHFICRHKHCSMLCLREFWIHNTPNSQYRCPACGEEYRPGKISPDLWSTNKVCFIEDELPIIKDQNMLRARGTFDVRPRTHVVLVPIMDNTADDWDMTRIQQILLDVDFALMTLQRKNRLGFVLKNIMSAGPSEVVKTHLMFQSTRDVIDCQNDRQALGNPLWQYNHIVKFGYQGIKAGPEHKLDKPMEFYDFVRRCGVAMWLTQKAAYASGCG
jgi:hypothetical protein